MIKLLASLIFLFIFTVSWSKENADTTKSKLEAEATVSLNSNITPFPGFKWNVGLAYTISGYSGDTLLKFVSTSFFHKFTYTNI